MKIFFRLLKFAALMAVIGGAFIAGILVHNAIFCGHGATLNFSNRSGQTVDSIHIENLGKSCEARGIEHGGTFSCRIEGLFEGPGFDVRVTLRNGKAFALTGPGYVTHGMNYVFDISIDEKGQLSFLSEPAATR